VGANEYPYQYYEEVLQCLKAWLVRDWLPDNDKGTLFPQVVYFQVAEGRFE